MAAETSVKPDPLTDIGFKLAAISLKMDTSLAVARANGRAMHDMELSMQAVVDAMSHFSCTIGTQTEAIQNLIEAATTEPESDVADMLRAILNEFDKLHGVVEEIRGIPEKLRQCLPSDQ